MKLTETTCAGGLAQEGDCCGLCNRPVPALTVHHLQPKSEGGQDGPRLELCAPCHKQIHALFDNTTLAREYDSVTKLREEPRVARFLRWVRKQDPGKRVRVYKPARRR
jgi:hypothetical protein